MKSKSVKVKIFDSLSILVLIISGILIIFSFFSPFIFVQTSKFGIKFSDTGSIGDTIGGLMNPFIALAGVFLTFLAFYIQLIANKQQRELFRKELVEQNIQFKKNQFENQFYEMLRLHKENVNEISIVIKSNYLSGSEYVTNENRIMGREVFKYYLNEIKILYYVAKKSFDNKDYNYWLREAYCIFFSGIKNKQKNTSYGFEENEYKNFLNKLLEIRKNNLDNQFNFDNQIKTLCIDVERYNYNLFNGYSTFLAHYYRHLFQTVKFVANQNEELINYEEKRKYLRILRAQLSSQEQEMLFYNWKSGYGSTWEDETNHFFTDYRMIHNIYGNLEIGDFNLDLIFKKNKGTYRTEQGRDNDPLFEFQD